MLKIVDGNGRPVGHPQFDRSSAVAFVGEGTNQFRVRAADLGNGHLEVTTSRVIAWAEADWAADYLADVIEVHERFREENPDELEARNRKRAARRARTGVRRLCKAMGATTLLTLTYHANETDLARCKADLKEYVRRVRRVLPGFRAVACFERQDRGAWHVHIATAGIPTLLPVPKGSGDFRSYNVLRAIWRSVTGERGGNIDVSRRRRHCRKSAAQIAAYIAKYIGKAFEDSSIEDGKNRWTKFGDVDVPELVDLGVVASLRDALEMAFVLLDADHDVAAHALDRWQDWHFLAAERRKGRIASSA